MLRDFKIIWLPIVLFLGATQPIVTYYLPSILEALGGGQELPLIQVWQHKTEAKY